MSTCPDEITKQERQLISQLRERVENELPDSIQSMTKDDQDLFLVRWLRVRDLHLDNATKMLRNSLQWRKVNNADKAVELEIHPFYQENFAFSYAGPDKNGHPVFLIPLANWDFRKILNNPERMKEFDDFTMYLFETLSKAVRDEHLGRRGTGHPPVTQFVIVLDVQKYSYGQLISVGAMKKLLQLASTLESYYPELLHRGFFLNCPFYFNMFITLLKSVLAPRTLAKLVCYPKMADWQKDMGEFLDPERIPAKYGGNAKNVVNMT